MPFLARDYMGPGSAHTTPAELGGRQYPEYGTPRLRDITEDYPNMLDPGFGTPGQSGFHVAGVRIDENGQEVVVVRPGVRPRSEEAELLGFDPNDIGLNLSPSNPFSGLFGQMDRTPLYDPSIRSYGLGGGGRDANMMTTDGVYGGNSYSWGGYANVGYTNAGAADNYYSDYQFSDQLGGGSPYGGGGGWDGWFDDGFVEPIILDLDGNGVRIETLETSRTYFDMAGNGGRNRTAWAGANDGVLAIDANGDGLINQRSEVVFTDWTGIAGNDMQALRMVFDSNNDGRLTSADSRWNEFKVVRNGEVKTLAELGITSISLAGDTVTADLPDGSQIQTSADFTINGVDNDNIVASFCGVAA